ncbi:ATP-dependent zinc metalloprotease FtsH [Flagellimonas meridianipacifica]|uniref:ATP-dependent zinc metalloprotease FtsH n=1 Tax=Flagellimonas meridianipacifica TaxID=1080225 RepID=A0A2T0MAW2_9FLAO|nr:ATP-dependent zinc metalloprotease FtsH [Allomuricauda pacifica]PRX54654.1 cell division protease FtsH [Allomuricauda pacifica]
MVEPEKNPQEEKPKRRVNLYWFYMFFLSFLLVTYFINSRYSTKEISWLEFDEPMLRMGDVAKVIVVNKEYAEIHIKKDRLNQERHKDVASDGPYSEVGPHYIIQLGSIESFEQKLSEAQQEFDLEDKIDLRYVTRKNWSDVFAWLLPFLFIVLFWIFIMRRMTLGPMGKGGNSLFNFGKSTAKLMGKDAKSKVTFDDVAGLQEAKVEVMEVVDFLKNPENYTKLGAKIPKGVLFVGPPGTGKTLMAKAVAGEAQVPFFSLSGSEFVEMFVGVGASRVRDLFKKAKEKAPSIVFIDEIDAVGRSRNKVNMFQANDERESTLNQLLAELDGFGENTGVIVLAATNRPDVLDKALLRPGRFDRHIYLELPNKQERKEIFEVHLRPIKRADGIDVELLASLTPGFSGADIANICNEAALIAARKKKDLVEKEDFIEARDRVVGGLERKSQIISPKEKRIIAFHEAGHAVVSWYLKNVDSLMKVSIIPRGKSLGAAWYLPEEYKLVTKSQFMDQMCAALGGRAAEEITFNEISTGALDDLEKVTKQAYGMVAYYGLDEEIGPLSFYDSTGQNEKLMVKPYGEHLAKLIDNEVQDLVLSMYKRAKELLSEHSKELEQLALLLLEKEVAEREDLERIMGKRNETPQSV